MSFWGRLFRRRTSGRRVCTERRADLPFDLGQEAMALATDYLGKGWAEPLTNARGYISGFWVRQPVSRKDEYLFLRALGTVYYFVTRGSVKEEPKNPGYYRVVPNQSDSRGGCFMMFGPDRAPGEQVPSAESTRWRKGKPNPGSESILHAAGSVWFACPTCGMSTLFDAHQMAEATGAMLKCEHCGNVSHIPGAYKRLGDGAYNRSGDVPQELSIRCCVCVPIRDFKHWFFSHPSFSPEAALSFPAYGLWAYCSHCGYPYGASAVLCFAMAQSTPAGQRIACADTPKSASEIQALLEGKCPSCAGANLLALMVDIPQHIRTAIAQRDTCGNGASHDQQK